MSGPNLDSNQWYHLYVTSGPGQGLIGNKPADDDPSSGVWFNPTNTTKPTFRWQIFQLNSTTWTLRCNVTGPDRYLAAGFFSAEEVEGQTRPYLARGDIADASAYWTLSPWGDGTFYMWNAANTSDYRLMKKGSGTMAMSPNITAPQAGQRWQFDKIEEINDAQYSTIGLVGATIATSAAIFSATNSVAPSPAPTASPTNGPSANDPTTSPGLSTGAKAAIAATVGCIVLLAICITTLCCLIRKMRRQKALAVPIRAPVEELYDAQTAPLTKHEMYHDDASRHEVPAQGIVEVPKNERPAELPSHTIER